MMIGKNAIWLSSLFVLVLLVPGRVHALGVSDATTHIYLSEQVSQLTEQLKVMQAQLQEAMKANETLMDSYEAVSGTYERATSIYDDVTKTKAFLNDSYRTVFGQYKKYKALYASLSDLDIGDAETLMDLLEGAFADPHTSTPKIDRQRAIIQYQIQQEALKKAIDDSENLLDSMPERVAKLKELGGQVGKGATMREGQTLTNSILLEILTVLQEQLALSMRFQQAMALSDFSGVQEDSVAARAAALKRIISNEDLIKHENDILETVGASEDSSLMEILESANM